MVTNLYRDLIVWEKSIDLIKKVYFQADALPRSEEYNLKQQLKRSIISVALNIAEGKSRRTAKDFIHFLNMSNASLAEVEAILLICMELGFLNVPGHLFEDIETISKMINSLISKLRRVVKSEK